MAIKVLYVIDTIVSDKAGTERQLLETIRRMDRNRFEPLLVCLYRSEWMKTNNVPVENMTFGYKGILKPSYPAVLFRLRKFIRNNRPDVVHVFFNDSLITAALASIALSKKPTLVAGRRDVGLSSVTALERLLPVFLKFYDGVLVNAEAIKKYVVKKFGVPGPKIRLIYNGIDPAPAPNRESGGTFTVAMTANLSPVKRHDLLVAAVQKFKFLRPQADIQVLLMGEGKLEPAIRKQIQVAGLENEFMFHGAVDDVIEKLRAADVGVLCSDREGLPNSILEYMAASLPVVATNVGGVPELVDESNGFLIPPGRAELLAEKLAALADDPALRKRMGDASRRKIEDQFSWEKTLRDLSAAYSKVIGRCI